MNNAMIKQRLKQAMLAVTLSSAMFLLSCNKDDGETTPEPVASFTFSIDEETGGIVTFTNTSKDADSYLWDFDDGTTSTQENPVKTYTEDGEYAVSLTATNEAGEDEDIQTVTITLVVDMSDTEAPVITLLGDAEVEIAIGEEYTDAGATATDNVDMDLTSEIEVTGEVNTLQPGEYTLTYNVSDAAGNAATEVTRTVTVTFDDGLLTNGDFETGDGTGWIGNGLDVRTEGGNSYTFANVTSAGNPFDVNVSQVVAMELGNTYRLSFNASTDQEDGRTILAGIGLNEAPFTNTTEEVTITTETQRFTYEFLANFESANSRVLFDMGADIGVVVIDNVSLELVSENTSSLPLTFETEDEVTVAFSGATFAFDEDPDDASNTVGKITNSGAAFEGVTFLLNSAVDFSINKEVTMQFNTSVSGIPVLMKFENGGDPIEVSATANSTGWQELTFDFTAATAAYRQVTVFVDGPGTTTGDFYIDDLTQSSGGSQGGCTSTVVAATSIPVDFEACESFIDTFDDNGLFTAQLADNPSKTGINTTDYVLQLDKPAGSSFFAGTQNVFSSNFDLTTNNAFYIDIYSTKPNVTFRFELLNIPNTVGNPAPVSVVIADANVWTNVKVEFTNLPGSATDYNTLVIKPDDDGSTDNVDVGGTYYIDNITLAPGCPLPPTGEFVTNGDWESGDECGWTILPSSEGVFEVTDAEAQAGTYSGRLSAAEVSGVPHNVLITQERLAEGDVSTGTAVTISFDVKGSNGAGGVLVAQLLSQDAGGGITNTEVLQGNILPDGTWTNYTYNVNLSGDVSGGVQLQLNAVCGAATGCNIEAFVDNVSLTID
ncbi:MAG: hypothetical protein Tsb0034_23780 [Ekhidna sp.]